MNGVYQNIALMQKDDDSDISDFKLAKLLPLKPGSNTHLDITETDVIECKAGWKLPVKTIAAFANNKGGYLVLGVVDKTWEIKGITQAKIDKFDFNQLNQTIRSNLGIEIEVKFRAKDFDGKKIAIFHISQAHTKPVIFSKGGDGIAEGQIFYRYIGEDRLISASEV